MKRWFLLLVVLLSVTGLQADEDALLDVPGRVAYIGSDYNVYTLSLHDGGLAQLTDDASRVRRYQWPTWADNDKLAYFCCQPLTGGFFTDIYVSSDGEIPGEQVYSGDGEVFTYAYWSPQDCQGGENCRDLAVLLNQGGFFSVEIFRNSAEGTENQTVGIGSPFYYSWSPDGRRMLLQRNNRRMEIYDVEDDELRVLDQRPGLIQAPEWSPVDDRLLFGALNNGENNDLATDLVIIANDEVQVLLEGIPGLVVYNWSPDGNYVAFRTLVDGDLSGITVVDTITGEVVAQTIGEDVYAFFWSPNSEKIAYVTLTTPQGSFSASNPNITRIAGQSQQQFDLAWAVLDVAADESRRYGTFTPTDEMIYIFNFFDQFAQSHRLWSPDSTHIVFAEITEAGDAEINVLDMTRPNAVPFSIADGFIGIWSYR